jgi:hypothetical protein
MTAEPSRFTASQLAELDEPVRRYLGHAIRDGAELGAGVRVMMTGRIKLGLWLPFTAQQECDGRSFAWRARVALGPLTALAVVDRFAAGAGSMDGRLFGRIKLFRADDANTTRSTAGRAALEAVYTPASLLPQRGITWRAETDNETVASWDVPPERPELHLQIDDRGAVRGYPRPAVGQRRAEGVRLHPVRLRGSGGAALRRLRRAEQHHRRLVVRDPALHPVLQGRDRSASGAAMRRGANATPADSATALQEDQGPPPSPAQAQGRRGVPRAARAPVRTVGRGRRSGRPRVPMDSPRGWRSQPHPHRPGP